MLSPTRIEHALRTEDYARLLNDLADNGMELPEPLRARLANPVAAPALGLRRLTELTFGPTPLREQATADLLARQNADGGFPDQADDSQSNQHVERLDAPSRQLFAAETASAPLATAAAAAAFERVLAEVPRTAGRGDLESACERAIRWLAKAQHANGDFADAADVDGSDRALTSGFLAFLLAESSTFAREADLERLLRWCEAHQAEMSDETARLWHMARVTAGTVRTMDKPLAA